MTIPTSLRLSLCAFALASGAALAADDGLPYTFVDIDYVSVDTGFGGSESGLSVDGSIDLDGSLYFVASLSDIDSVSTVSLGLGLRGEVGDDVDAFGELQVLSTESGNGPNRGFTIGGGVRGMATEQLELFGRIDHVDVGNASDQGLTFGATYYFDRIGVSAQYSSGDDVDGVAFGVRITF